MQIGNAIETGTSGAANGRSFGHKFGNTFGRKIGAKQLGFTLIELVVVMTIAAIMLALAIPSFTTTLQSNRAKNAAGALYRGILLARGQALARGTQVAMVAATGGWINGYQVFVDVNANGAYNQASGDTALDTAAPLDPSVAITVPTQGNLTKSTTLAFSPSGFPIDATSGAALTGVVEFCVTVGTYIQKVQLSGAGLAQVQSVTACP